MFLGYPGFISVRRVALITVLALHAGASLLFAQANAPANGGFVDSATATSLRPSVSAGQAQTFLPERGRFTFPAPYNTTGIRLTNSSDCGGQDCVVPVGYAYWSNINNHIGSDTMLIFLALERRAGGGGPTLFSYNKNSGETRNLGPLFDSSSPYSWANGEGWYFSATRPNALYMFSGSRLMRFDVQTRALETVFDATVRIGANRIVWQIHSSNDDRVHSMTIRDGSSYEMLGCAVYREDTQQTSFYAKRGDYDECQVDKSGRWLVIKENVDNRYNEDNRIIDLQTGGEQVFYDENGAAGHSDVGYGYIVGEDDRYNAPGAVRVWEFGQPQSSGRLVYQMASWNGGLGHVAHGNAQPGEISQQMVCSSNANRQNQPRLNEIVCYRLNDSLNALVVAPNMTDLNASGGGSDDYMKLPKGNLDITGEYFIWTANVGTSRMDAFVVRVPQTKLAGAGAGTPVQPVPVSPAPTPSPTPSPAPAPLAPAPVPPSISAPGGPELVRWTNVANAVVSGGSLQKSAGCGGCPDAGAVSEQPIVGSGSVEFSTTESGSLRFVGLSQGSTDPGSMAYALRLQGGVAEVREAGAYRTEIFFSPGDTLRIGLNDGRVTYAKNGAVFYTSATPAGRSYVLAAMLFDMDAAVTNALIVSGVAPAGSPSAPAPDVTVGPITAPEAPALAPAPAPEPAPAPGRRVRWPGRR